MRNSHMVVSWQAVKISIPIDFQGYVAIKKAIFDTA
jgi:hypothetical protein